jgi:hypothetical protein
MADQEEKTEQQEENVETPEGAEEAPEAEAAEADEAPTEEVAAEAEAPAEEPAAEEPTSEEPADEAAAEAPAEEAVAEEAPAEEEAAEAEAPAEEAAEEPAAAEGTPEYTYEVLHKMTVADLRDLAQGVEHDALAGYSTMHKEHLVPALCTALGIEAHAHHEVIGINKDRVKGKIRDLKVERQKALDAGDHAQLKLVRKRIKSLKRKIRRATV